MTSSTPTDSRAGFLTIGVAITVVNGCSRLSVGILCCLSFQPSLIVDRMLTSRSDKCILAVGTSWRTVYTDVVGRTESVRINRFCRSHFPSIAQNERRITHPLLPPMAFSAARTQFQPPLQKLASARLLETLLHRFGHAESVAVSPESFPLHFQCFQISGSRIRRLVRLCCLDAASHRN